LTRDGPPRGWCAAGLALGLLTACAPPPPPAWQRSDVSPATAQQVELDCRQRSIEAFGAGNNPDDAKAVHDQRQGYFERCMRGSGFELR